jgi:CBS domain containing-hemolysin-like protein
VIQLDTLQIIAIVTALVGGIGVLFRALTSSYEARIRDKQVETDRAYALAKQLSEQVVRMTETTDRAVTVVERKATP